MTNTALISGQAGVAVWINGASIRSFHLEGSADVKRCNEEVPRLFGGCPDIVKVEGIELDAVPACLELHWKKHRCLSLCLLLLDRESHSESRELAIAATEELLAEPEVGRFLRSRLFVAPMPEEGDLPYAIDRVKGRAPALEEILREVDLCQAQIRRCRAAWDDLPMEIFGDEFQKEEAAFALIETGAFYMAAITADAKRWLPAALLSRPELENWSAGVSTWIDSFADGSEFDWRMIVVTGESSALSTIAHELGHALAIEPEPSASVQQPRMASPAFRIVPIRGKRSA